MRALLDHMTRLSYHERIARDLPPAFKPFLPHRFVGNLDWSEIKEGDTEPNSAASLSAALLGKLRAKVPSEQVLSWVESELNGSNTRIACVPLVVHTLLHAGAKSVSHLEKLLEKFAWLLSNVANTPATRVELLSAACRYWAASPQMCIIVVAKMRRYRIIDAEAVG